MVMVAEVGSHITANRAREKQSEPGWSLQHSGPRQQRCRQTRNMNQQVEHWSSGLTPIVFLNLHQRDLVNIRMLRQAKKQEETAGLNACVIVSLRSDRTPEPETRKDSY